MNPPDPGTPGTALRFAVERAQEFGLSSVVVASTSGETGLIFLETLKGTGLQLIVVTHDVGFSEPGFWEFSNEAEERLGAAGVRLVTGTHALLEGFPDAGFVINDKDRGADRLALTVRHGVPCSCANTSHALSTRRYFGRNTCSVWLR